MVRTRVPKEYGDYGIRWVTYTSVLMLSSAGSLEGGIPLT